MARNFSRCGRGRACLPDHHLVALGRAAAKLAHRRVIKNDDAAQELVGERDWSGGSIR